MPADHTHELAHLKSNGDWCEFHPVVVNPIDAVRTITILECACGIALRLVERELPPEPGRPTDQPARRRRGSG
jgi:hypothetical protein